MSVKTNIGKISAAIEAGRRAYDAIDKGPVVSSHVLDTKELFADWQLIDAPNDAFIAGVHNWADPSKKVTR